MKVWPGFKSNSDFTSLEMPRLLDDLNLRWLKCCGSEKTGGALLEMANKKLSLA